MGAHSAGASILFIAQFQTSCFREELDGLLTETRECVPLEQLRIKVPATPLHVEVEYLSIPWSLVLSGFARLVLQEVYHLA